MSWRTDWCGCGAGVGCSHEQPTPVCVIQGESLLLMLPASEPVGGQLVRAEVRTQPLGKLLLDMTPYCHAVVEDPAVLVIDVPAEVTAGLLSSGFWDAWVGDERVGHGPFVVELAVSARPGRVATVQSWTPMFSAGEEFTRTISVTGLLPDGDELSWEDPELLVTGVDGGTVLAVKGPPHVLVSADLGVVVVSLSSRDTAAIGVGRFTYSLMVRNQYGDRRTLLSGMMLVDGGGAGGPKRQR